MFPSITQTLVVHFSRSSLDIFYLTLSLITSLQRLLLQSKDSSRALILDSGCNYPLLPSVWLTFIRQLAAKGLLPTVDDRSVSDSSVYGMRTG